MMQTPRNNVHHHRSQDNGNDNNTSNTIRIHIDLLLCCREHWSTDHFWLVSWLLRKLQHLDSRCAFVVTAKASWLSSMSNLRSLRDQQSEFFLFLLPFFAAAAVAISRLPAASVAMEKNAMLLLRLLIGVGELCRSPQWSELACSTRCILRVAIFIYK